MNAFNRVVVVLLLLAIMVVSAIFFIVPLPALRVALPFLERLQATLLAMTGPRALLRIGVGLLFTFVVWVFCAALLWLEVRRPRTRTIKVQKVSGGEAELTTDSIASRLEYNIDQLADVIRVKPTISSGRKGVLVDLELETNPEIEVPMKTEEVQQVTKDIIENRLGLKLDSVRVVIRHAPYPKETALKPGGYVKPSGYVE
ncbi:MAG: hypothetical protein Kow0063_03490 [Anaerolineae bacterium]